MKRRRMAAWATAMCLACLAVSVGCRSRDARFVPSRVPPGFSIEAVASATHLGPLSGLTFDSRGRPVVIKERGLATLLLDNNRDGIFETEKVLTTAVHAVRGLWFDGRTLYLLGSNGSGQYGLYRLEDRDNDDQFEIVDQLSVFDAPAPGPHDIRRGPDGSLTLLQGGKWLRWNEDRHSLTVLAAGLANPRAHAYDSDGEAFLLDAGNPEDIAGLPPTSVRARRIHAVPGGEYGGPEDRFDVLPPMPGGSAATGGMDFYQHSVYPEVFRGALFQAEGPAGRIVARDLLRSGATYKPVERPIGEFTVTDPLIVTDIKVGPDGFVYFTAAGPGGKGGLYRISYTSGWLERWERRRSVSDQLAVVRQPQPLSSWGHAALARQRELLESRWGESLEMLAQQAGAAPVDRVCAILLLHRFGPKPKPGMLAKLSTDAEPRVRAASVYVAGEQGNASFTPLVEAALKDRDPLVRRRAAEAMGSETGPSPYPLLADPDRFVRYAARRALERVPREEWKSRVFAETGRRASLEGMLALVATAAGRQQEGEREAVIERLLPMIADSEMDAVTRLDAVRLLVLASEQVNDAGLRRRSAAILLPMFTAAGGGEALDRELAPALAWSGGTEAIQKLLDAMAKTAQEQPVQVYYAQCLRSIADGWTPAQKETMLGWFDRSARSSPGMAFTRLLSQLFEAFVQTAISRADRSKVRRRMPMLAGASASAPTAEETFELQLSDPPPAATPGQGKEVFAKQCASCHRFGSLGSEAGPDLTGIGARLERAALLEAILWPSRLVSPEYRSEAIQLADGSVIEALVMREDDRVLLLRTPGDPRPISILKSAVTDRRKLEKSLMPEGLLDRYDQGAIASLLSFLQAKAE